MRLFSRISYLYLALKYRHNPITKDITINDNDIYEGIYPHYINIEERLDLIFTFVKGDFPYYSLKINSEEKKNTLGFINEESSLENDEITADELASWYGTIGYEVVCGISKRVPRIYID